MELKVDSEFKSIMPGLTQEEYQELEKSILTEGCRDALVVWNELIVDGFNRYEICQRHSIPFSTIEREFASRAAAKTWIIDNQFARRNLNREQKRKLIECRLKLSPKKSDRQIALKLGVSPTTVGSIRHDLEKSGKVSNLDTSTGADGKEYPRKPKGIRAAVECETPVLPVRKYKVILADPPWRYDHGDIPHGGVEKHYKTMSIQDIKALPVQSLSDSVCFLFLWATFPKIRDSLETIEAWGFEYKTLAFAWVKTNMRQDLEQVRFLDEAIDDCFGIGYYTKSNCEVCLLGTKGDTKALHALIQDRTVRSTVIAPRGEHSKKPDEVRRRIVQLLGDLPRIELFARQRFPGWDVWGNEVETVSEVA